MNRRENTFRIDYANIPKKPSFDEIHNFIGEELGLKREDILRIQCSKYLGCVFVKTSDLSIAQRIVDEHDGKHERVFDNKAYPIRLLMEDGGTDVKLSDLSEDISDQTITDFFGSFGDVLSIRDLTWDGKYRFEGISTGVRIARMIVKRNIPSVVTIDGESTCISYNGQIPTCRHCGESIHNGIPCIQNKKLLVQKLAADQAKPSYANVAKQSSAPKKATSHLSRATRSSSSSSASHTPTQQSIRPTTTSPAKAVASTNSESVDKSSTNQQTHPNSTVTNRKIEPNTFLMPPPAFPSTSKANQLEESAHHPRTEDSQRSDGHETDESSTSNNSLRRSRRGPYAKKMRHQAENDTTIESANF